MKMLGFCGTMSSGKNFAADHVVNKHGFWRESFAKPVKDATAAIFGWDRNMLEGDTDESRVQRELVDQWWSDILGFPVTPRWAMQKMGNEVGREHFHSQLWIYSLLKRIANNKINDRYVISDVRYPNEIDFIMQMGGHVIVVECPSQKPAWLDLLKNVITMQGKEAGNHFMTNNYGDVHYSEWAWVGHPVNDTIYNDKDENFTKAIDSVIMEIL